MKFLIMLVTTAALAAPQTAEAHNRHRSDAHATVSVGTPAVSVTWVWVPATRVCRAHWLHPEHGRDFGPNRPVVRPLGNVVWVSGHWVGQAHRRRASSRRWVPGHWQQRPATRRTPTRNQRRR
jgi:hypothetical protein